MEKLYILSDESLDWRHEPGVESVAVGRDGHGVLDLLLEERLPDEQDGDAEDEEEDAEDRRGHAAVPRVLAVAAPLRGLGTGRCLEDINIWHDESRHVKFKPFIYLWPQEALRLHGAAAGFTCTEMDSLDSPYHSLRLSKAVPS